MVAGGIVRESGMGTYTLLYLTHNQQGPTHFIAQGTLLNIMWQPRWEGSLGENGYMYMYGWVPCCSPKTITLLISYTPIQNKKFKRKNVPCSHSWKCTEMISSFMHSLSKYLSVCCVSRSRAPTKIGKCSPHGVYMVKGDKKWPVSM